MEAIMKKIDFGQLIPSEVPQFLSSLRSGAHDQPRLTLHFLRDIRTPAIKQGIFTPLAGDTSPLSFSSEIRWELRILIDSAHAAWRVSGKCSSTRRRLSPSYLFVLKRVETSDWA